MIFSLLVGLFELSGVREMAEKRASMAYRTVKKRKEQEFDATERLEKKCVKKKRERKII